MNSIIAHFALILLVSWAARGQSSFSLSNFDGRGVNAPVFDAGGVPLTGPNYVAELWGGANPDSLSPALTSYSSHRLIIPFESQGYFRDSYVGRDGGDAPAIPSVPFFGYAWLEVRAWDARLGSTHEEVVARGLGGFGESALFYAQGSSAFCDPPCIPAPLIGLESFSLRAVIPEPSTWALLACGGLGLGWAIRHTHKIT